jgi:hypothetical protein
LCPFPDLTLALHLVPLLPSSRCHFCIPDAHREGGPLVFPGDQRLTGLLFSPSRRFCRVKVDVNEHDIANRIMRRDNFMIAMVMKVRM